MAAASPRLFDMDGALALRDGGHCNGAYRHARGEFDRWRRANGGPGGIRAEAEDITGAPWWQAYLANRTDEALTVIFGGPGVAIQAVEFRFLRVWDRNMKERRCDIVFHRADGMAVWMHPGSRSDAPPVIGIAQEWMVDQPYRLRGASVGARGVGDAGQGGTATLAAAHGAGAQGRLGAWYLPRSDRVVYDRISQNDQISSVTAARWLRRREEEADARGWPRWEFCEDLTDQRSFAWPLLLAGVPGASVALSEGVEAVWVVWLGAPWHRPALWVATPSREWICAPAQTVAWDVDALDAINWSA